MEKLYLQNQKLILHERESVFKLPTKQDIGVMQGL
jgi:hypothetical protein